MPNAAMSRGRPLARLSASTATPIWEARISSGSCSTQGKGRSVRIRIERDFGWRRRDRSRGQLWNGGSLTQGQYVLHAFALVTARPVRRRSTVIRKRFTKANDDVTYGNFTPRTHPKLVNRA